jgi:cytochrome c-type biogenesis protein CcmE
MSEEIEDGKPETSGVDDGVLVPRRRREREREQEDDPQATRRRMLLVIPLVAAAAAIVATVLTGMKDNAIYSKPVDQLVAQKARFQGRAVRAEGNLVHGSLVKRDSPCEYRFTISKNGTDVPVRYAQCVVPDTFRDVPGMDVGVTVEGQLLADNSFEATSVLAKCPSKYEMKERAGRGEQMPHAALESNGGATN